MSEFQQYRKKSITIKAKQMDEPFEVETLEGTMKGKPGDYLVVGIVGEKYPVDKDIFEYAYDLGSIKSKNDHSYMRLGHNYFQK